MPLFKVTDPNTGKTVQLTGDSPPNEQELEEIFLSLVPQQEVQDVIPSTDVIDSDLVAADTGAGLEIPRDAPVTGADDQQDAQALIVQFEAAKASGDFQTADRLRQQISALQSGGFVETAATVASGVIAEPAAGIAGIFQTLNPFAEPGAGAEAVEATRKALTFEPKTESGQMQLRAFGEFLEPVGEVFTEAERILGDAAFKATNSPAVASIAATIPAAVVELLGFGAGKQLVKQSQKARRAAKEGEITRELSESVPTIDQLKGASKEIYKEIDDLNVVVNPESFNRLVDDIIETTENVGIDPDITPAAAKAVKRFDELRDQTLPLSEIDKLREVAQNAAGSLNKRESAMGIRIIDSVDQFLDNADVSDFSRIDGPVEEISKRYRVARDLWGRARRSELIEEAFEKARNQASGFENGIRTQFRQILNNKKQKRFFNKEERAAMVRVVRGGPKENFAKLVGRLGFSEQGATNILGGAIGATAGAAVLGTPGAVLVPAIGTISRRLAQRMTARNAEFADEIIRAGKDARKITKAYIKNTPKGLRDPAELSELLMRPTLDITDIPDITLAKKAAEIVRQKRGALVGILAPNALQEEN